MELLNEINERRYYLEDKLDSINSSLREEHRRNPLRWSIIGELNKQYRECFYALSILEYIMKE